MGRGILHAVGWINFLTEPGSEPHMSVAELAAGTGVGESTLAARLRVIRDELGIQRLDPEWTLPSALAANPRAWLVDVDGIVLDMRDVPRELQEEAYRRRLIPFLPPASRPEPQTQTGQNDLGAGKGARHRRQVAPGAKEAGPQILRLGITLRGSRPRIFRRVLVLEEVTLLQLHATIQAAMGWEEDHLWRFEIGGIDYAELPDDPWSDPMASAARARLCDLVAPGSRFLYEYDFGDSWQHLIRVEKRLPPERGALYPVCTLVERACPPEDSGGIYGYYDWLHAYGDPEAAGHDEAVERLGEGFDPDAVDLDTINARLALLSPLRRRAAGTRARASTQRPASEEPRATRTPAPSQPQPAPEPAAPAVPRPAKRAASPSTGTEQIPLPFGPGAST